ncbi:hypothetical protein TVAG_483080 [Trichomonas vaginalis G3]|uniref:Uncharacterized protein n=1 Tax=Trichomonas vaginalis (strain ATCC PRA-98 / G3) TaxID=412133 RepID=A2FAK8_TRIV3|nr:spectrin binding [Trichomonas vaginalis G3]EAX98051.1 hypothetical protein TVAG_483080 [Trichomonas vaginalis G3]KAI5549744.1 spectrin binding [Trichomonas vaginalis G3]|eukprot:XP_001310981.1 hypothetical protein [Trichomonas vaginalis G3]
MSTELIEKAWVYSQFNNVEELAKLVPSQVSADASIKSPTNQVHTLLMIAAASGADETCQYLIEKGANVNKKNPFGYSALHWAAYCGRSECVEQLIKAGASFEDKIQEGKNALHIAAFRGHIQFIESILELGADINSVSSNGLCAMHYAIRANQHAVAKFLQQHGIEYDGLDPDRQTLEQFAEKFDRKWIKDVLQPAEKKEEEKPEEKKPEEKKPEPVKKPEEKKPENEDSDEDIVKFVEKKAKKALSPKKH